MTTRSHAQFPNTHWEQSLPGEPLVPQPPRRDSASSPHPNLVRMLPHEEQGWSGGSVDPIPLPSLEGEVPHVSDAMEGRVSAQGCCTCTLSPIPGHDPLPPPETSDVAPKVRSPRERSQGKEGRLDLHSETSFWGCAYRQMAHSLCPIYVHILVYVNFST